MDNVGSCLEGGIILCLVFGIPFVPIFDLFVWRRNKGPLVAFLLCEQNLLFKASLSHITW